MKLFDLIEKLQGLADEHGNIDTRSVGAGYHDYFTGPINCVEYIPKAGKMPAYIDICAED